MILILLAIKQRLLCTPCKVTKFYPGRLLKLHFFKKSFVEPPLHSTAIYSDEVELSKHCTLFIPSTPQGKEVKRRYGYISSSYLFMVNGISEKLFKVEPYKTKVFKRCFGPTYVFP